MRLRSTSNDVRGDPIILSTSAPTNADVTIVNPPDLYDPAANGYSHATIARGGSRIAYIAGQGGEDKDGALSPAFACQVKQAFANLRSVLKAVGGRPNQVARITTYVVGYDQSMLAVMTAAAKETFGDALPAQSLVPVPRLALDGMLFEVDAIAVLDEAAAGPAGY